MKKATLKWFTLIEMMIVIVIIWILAVVLTESYLTISKTALRIEQEKNLSEESLILTQVFQAISDEATIDYEAYSGNLSTTSWFTDILYLTWWQWSWTSIYTTWDCLDLDKNFEPDEEWNINKVIQDYTGCYLVMKQWETITQLTTPWKVVISSVKFRVIPYNSDKEYFCIGEDDWDCVISEGMMPQNELHQPAFWMFIHLYAPLYQPTGTNKIDLPLQLFFNLNL